jgi:acetyl esterase/lipase
MTSAAYRIEIQFVRWFGHKRIFGLPETEMRLWLRRAAEHRSTAVPRLIRLTHTVHDQLVKGRPCPIISPQIQLWAGAQDGSAPSEYSPSLPEAQVPQLRPRAGAQNIPRLLRQSRLMVPPLPQTGAQDAPVVLFLHGGGFLFEALPVHWLAVDRLIRKTGAEVWFASYPLLPQATIYESHDMVLATWQQMRKRHGADQITVLGDSAGATLALTLTHALKAIGQALPHQLILASPAQSLISPELRTQMAAFAPLDAMIPPSLLDVLVRLMPERPHTPPWMLHPLEGDFTGFPKTMVLSGTHEIFYPLMPDFLERLAAAEVPTEFISGEQMCHVWPYVPVAPECVHTLDHMIAAIQ